MLSVGSAVRQLPRGRAGWWPSPTAQATGGRGSALGAEETVVSGNPQAPASAILTHAHVSTVKTKPAATPSPGKGQKWGGDTG